MTFTLIDKTRAKEIAELAVCLTNEIIEKTGIKAFNVDAPLAERLCERFIDEGKYTVIAALDGDRIVGFGALCESYSIYAGGSFGIIQEFYVLPEYRSKNIGSKLIDEIERYASVKEWRRLELCTPPIPEFNRTVQFYQSNGFERTGGYKMKKTVKT